MPTPTLIWSDDFNRTVAVGLGPRYTMDWMNTTEASVDGSVAVGSPIPGESVGYVGFAGSLLGITQFDFLVASTAPPNPEFIYYEVVCEGTGYGQDLYVFHDSEDIGQWWVGSGSSQDDLEIYPTPGDWWTAKCQLTAQTCLVKAWKRGDPEPTEWFDGGLRLHASYSAYIEMWSSGDSPPKMDNLFIWSYPDPPPPAVVLTDSLWEAPDCYPGIRRDGGVGRATETLTMLFGTDVNDPTIADPITGAPFVWLAGSDTGVATAWAKVVLPTRGTLDFDAEDTGYQSALALFRLEPDGVTLTLLDVNVPWVSVTKHLPHLPNGAWEVHSLVHGNITPGSGAMPTGIPGVTHADLVDRRYVLFEFDLPGGGAYSYPPDVWAYTHPFVSYGVHISGNNYGYTKTIRLQWEFADIDDVWTPVGFWQQPNLWPDDSRSGDDFTYGISPVKLDGYGAFKGRLRLVLTEKGNGSELWLKSYTWAKVEGYLGHRRTIRRTVYANPRLVSDLPAGTYYVCLTGVHSSIGPFYGYANLKITLTHPMRTDG